MATELTETTSTTYNELYRDVENVQGIKLAAATYTAGTIVCSNAGANFAKTDILLTSVAGHSTQTVAVILEDVVIGTNGDIGLAAFEGTFNRAKIVFNGSQTEATVNGILQNKEIILEDWSK